MPTLIRIMIRLPEELKDRLDRVRQRGYTTSGFIRALLNRDFGNLVFN